MVVLVSRFLVSFQKGVMKDMLMMFIGIMVENLVVLDVINILIIM